MPHACCRDAGERVIIDVQPVADLSTGRIAGQFVCRASTLTSAYVHLHGGMTSVVVSARSTEEAVAQIEAAIASGLLVRRERV